MRRASLPATVMVGALALGMGSAQQQRQSPAIVRAYLDTTCAPCDDFWRFANGAWIDSAQFPAGRTSVSRDAAMEEQRAAVIRALLDSLAYAPERHARTQQDRNVGRFFAACMDTTRSASEEMRPLAPQFQRLASITTMSEVSEAIGHLTALQVSPLFWFVVVPDPPDPTRQIAEIRGVYGWTLPSPLLYTGTDPTSEGLRVAYVEALAGVFRLIGQAPERARESAESVLAVETAIARAQPTGASGALAPHSLDELQRLVPAFDWRAFARGIGRPSLERIHTRPVTRAIIEALADSIPVEQWRAYLAWQFAYAIAPMTFGSLDTAIRPFRRAVLGLQGQGQRAALCVPFTTRWLGDGVARAYVARAFSPSDRAAAVALVERMRGVFRERLATLEWISPESRLRAVAKLDSMQLWIGYPERWDADADLSLPADVGSALLLEVRRQRGREAIASIGAAIDRTRWVEANAAFADLSYYPSRNALLATAGMLQPPVFDPRADVVTNLANVGFGIGHELSHGFDSNGRLFNGFGARHDWWTPDEAREYQRRAELVVAQYNDYVVIDSFRTNGRRSLGENISDINGVALAYETFRRVTAGQPNVTIDGFTREQRFFIALAQGKFRVKSNDAETRRLINAPYAANQWRLNGALANLPAFAAAFGCKDGDRMVRKLPLRANIF